MNNILRFCFQHSSTLNDQWDSVPDNEFAGRFFKSVGWNEVKPEESTVSSLCTSCRAIDSTRLFNYECNVEELELTSHSCDLCRLFFSALENIDIRPPRVITPKQDGITVSVKDGPRLLSIYMTPGIVFLIYLSYRIC